MLYSLLPWVKAQQALLNCFDQTNEEFALSTPESGVLTVGSNQQEQKEGEPYCRAEQTSQARHWASICAKM